MAVESWRCSDELWIGDQHIDALLPPAADAMRQRYYVGKAAAAVVEPPKVPNGYATTSRARPAAGRSAGAHMHVRESLDAAFVQHRKQRYLKRHEAGGNGGGDTADNGVASWPPSMASTSRDEAAWVDEHEAIAMGQHRESGVTVDLDDMSSMQLEKLELNMSGKEHPPSLRLDAEQQAGPSHGRRRHEQPASVSMHQLHRQYRTSNDGSGRSSSAARRRRPASVPPNDVAALAAAAPAVGRFGTFDIFYKNLDTVHLGDVLHGWMELHLARPMDIVKMTVSFYGEIAYSVGGQAERSVRFERQSQNLWRASTGGRRGGSGGGSAAHVTPGFYVYEFFVGTRMDLPSAFVSKEGAIASLVYFCEVRITEACPSAPGARRPRAVEHIKRRPVYLRTSPGAAPYQVCRRIGASDGTSQPSAVCQRAALRVRNVLDASGCIVCTVAVAQRQCAPGDNLVFSVELLNCHRQLRVHAALLQLAKVVGRGADAYGGDLIRHTLYRVKLGAIAAAERHKTWSGLTVWIPHPGLVPVHISQIHRVRMVFLGYHLVVSVKPIVGKRLDVQIPLVVRNSIRPVARKYRTGLIQSGAVTL